MRPRWYLRFLPSPLIVAPFETYVAVSAVLTGASGALFPQTYRLSPVVTFVGPAIARSLFALYCLSGVLILIGLVGFFHYAKDRARFAEAAGMFLAAFVVAALTGFSIAFYARVDQLAGGLLAVLGQVVLLVALAAWGAQIAIFNRIAQTQRLIAFSKLDQVGRLSQRNYLRVIQGDTPGDRE